MDKTYREHYEYCKKQFTPSLPTINIENLTITDNLKTTTEYYKLIYSLRNKVDIAFTDRKNYNKDSFRDGIKDATVFSEVGLIHDYFYDQISTNFFGSDYTSNRIQICKSIHTKVDLESSWLWHYDDNGPTHIKLFIYLSDVESKSDGAFCCAKYDNGEVFKIPTSKIGPHHRTTQAFLRSRVPKEFIEQNRLKENYVLGKKGKCFLFDPNIIHKATVPESGHERIALIYHYHPTSNKVNICNHLDVSVKDYILQ